MELGKKIKQLRFKAALTQEQLADKVGVGPQAVSKWENNVAMPDITVLPILAEIFGVSIDELFDLTAEQRLNRIENRMDLEEDLPQDIFMEYEEFLKTQLQTEKYKTRATELLAYLYFHRMDTYSRKASRYAKESVKLNPYKKGCQWILSKTDGHCIWDWNMANHTPAIDFYRDMIREAPDSALAYEYLIDNLLADHRTDEAQQALEQLCSLEGSFDILNETYRAHIALARFDEAQADQIIEQMLKTYENSERYEAALFEAAQYYAAKCDYDKAVDCYERSFEEDKRRPRFQDALMAIADIYRIRGDWRRAAETYDRIVDLLKNEWSLTEEVELKDAQSKRAALLAKT